MEEKIPLLNENIINNEEYLNKNHSKTYSELNHEQTLKNEHDNSFTDSSERDDQQKFENVNYFLKYPRSPFQAEDIEDYKCTKIDKCVGLFFGFILLILIFTILTLIIGFFIVNYAN